MRNDDKQTMIDDCDVTAEIVKVMHTLKSRQKCLGLKLRNFEFGFTSAF